MVDTSPGVSSFAVVIAFLYITLTKVTFVPLLPVGLSPSHALPRLAVDCGVPNGSTHIVRVRIASQLRTVLTHVGKVGRVGSASNGK